MKKLRFNALLIVLMLFNCKDLSAQENQLLRKNLVSNISNIYGSTRLIEGVAFIELSENQIKEYQNVKYSIFLTPIGSWSALYVKEINEKGFFVKAENGDLNAKFFWQISPMTIPEEIK